MRTSEYDQFGRSVSIQDAVSIQQGCSFLTFLLHSLVSVLSALVHSEQTLLCARAKRRQTGKSQFYEIWRCLYFQQAGTRDFGKFLLSCSYNLMMIIVLETVSPVKAAGQYIYFLKICCIYYIIIIAPHGFPLFRYCVKHLHTSKKTTIPVENKFETSLLRQQTAAIFCGKVGF